MYPETSRACGCCAWWWIFAFGPEFQVKEHRWRPGALNGKESDATGELLCCEPVIHHILTAACRKSLSYAFRSIRPRSFTFRQDTSGACALRTKSKSLTPRRVV